MPIVIPQSGVVGTRRTLGSFSPNPANIGKIAGAHLGIIAPSHMGTQKLHLAGGGIANAENISNNMFSPVNSGVGVPNVDVNFITSPNLARGPGPPTGHAPQPQKEPDGMQQVAEGTSAANGLTGLYDKFGASAGTPLGIAGSASDIGLPSVSEIAANPATDFSAFSGAADMATAATATDAAAASSPEWLTALMAFFADGGAVPLRADGGKVEETYHHSGLLNSAGPGRTDTINTHVPAGAYVIPADIVSGVGQGNTVAGSAIIGRMFPEPPNPAPSKDKAPVVVAGGEMVISPQAIINKFGSLKRGHASIDHWVVMERQRIAKEMLKLPNPVGSKVKKK